MESPRTLLHTPPSWEPATGEARRPRRISRGVRASEPAESLVLGRYRLFERLGRGGFGEVWRAQDELLHREVAVKRIWLGPDGDSERATREAHAAARLAHPAIVALYEACTVDDAFYLISELVEGETFASLIAAGALEDEEVVEIGVALADALTHAHARGVIHRDIKPQNVLVPDRPDGASGPAKLTDFGGASLVGEDALTRTGDVLGTLAYMAPEQSEGREVGAQSDLYSLALVLYEALCGVNPVRGATPAATARQIGADIEPLERRRGDLPRELTRALDAALAPAPADRGTLEWLRCALEDCLEQGLERPRRRRVGGAGRNHERQREPARPQPAISPPRESTARQPRVPRRLAPTPETALFPESAQDAPPSRLALPRQAWIACALAIALWQAWAGRPGVTLLILAAALPLAALPRRVGPAWLGCALAPALGTVGLAGAFPALAGQAARWRERAALGALAYWWLLLAEPLLDRRLWLGAPSGTPARAVWESSLGTAATHLLGPMLTIGVLLGAALWGAAAIALPWIVRGRSAVVDALAAAVWSVGIVIAAPPLDAGLAAHGAHPSPHGAVLGAVLGGLLALAARALRGPV